MMRCDAIGQPSRMNLFECPQRPVDYIQPVCRLRFVCRRLFGMVCRIFAQIYITI